MDLPALPDLLSNNLCVTNDILIHPLAWVCALSMISIYPIRAFIRRGQDAPTRQKVSRPDIAYLVVGLIVLGMLIFG